MAELRPGEKAVPFRAPIDKAVFVIGVVVSLAHIYFNTLATLPELWTSALHFAGFGLMCALATPFCPARGERAQKSILMLDLLLGTLAILAVLYLLMAEDSFYARGSNFILSDWVFSAICVVLAIEFTRRTSGWIIPILIVVSLGYVAWWGRLIDGVLHFPGLSVEIVLFRQFFSGDGMFGPIARISSTYVFMFILFGAFLLRSGAGQFIIDIARCVAGRMIGGPGLVAVIGSALMGSISGSAVANTVSTGVITIPLMRRTGFPPRFAAGVEAAASTGGQLMPPIMGAGAFVMSTYTQIPYLEIIAVALLPALLYFISVAFWVRIEAMKHGLGKETADGPTFFEVLRHGGHNLIPIVVLAAMLIFGFTPTYAAGFAILATIAASWLSTNRMGLRAIVEALAAGARNMASMAVLLIGVGIVVNVVSTTGIGNTFSLMIADWAGGSLALTLLLIAIASLVLGMGLPVTAAYIVLATLSAPAIYDLIIQARLVEALMDGGVPPAAAAILALVAPDQVGQLSGPMSRSEAGALVALIPWELLPSVTERVLDPVVLTATLLSAHMVIYWLSQDSNVTPPVCLAAFAAATIAETSPMRTGFTAWKVAKGLYIVPVLIAYTPLLGGDFAEMIEVFVFAVLGIYALNGAIGGHLESPLNWVWRLFLVGCAGALLWPGASLAHACGAVVFAVILTVNWRAAKRRLGIDDPNHVAHGKTKNDGGAALVDRDLG